MACHSLNRNPSRLKLLCCSCRTNKYLEKRPESDPETAGLITSFCFLKVKQEEAPLALTPNKTTEKLLKKF